jgi:hypothetical protein
MPYRTAQDATALNVYVMRLEAASTVVPEETAEKILFKINNALYDLGGIGVHARAELEVERPAKAPIEALAEITYMPPETVHSFLKEGSGYLDMANEVLIRVEVNTYVAMLLRELARRL